ncbi:MAG: hypothetical protein ACRDOI_05290 [Trebonia sp.]
MSRAEQPKLWPLKPFTAAVEIKSRILELGIKLHELDEAAEMHGTDLKYFPVLCQDQQTLEWLSTALGWSPDYLNQWWSGEWRFEEE